MKTNYNAISVEAMQALNQKQTVLIETNYKKDEKGTVEVTGKRIFLGNFCKRAEAYYDCFIKEEFKHKRNVQEYRLLKLNKAVEEVKDATYPVEYLKSENYKEEEVATKQEEATEVSEPEQPQAEEQKKVVAANSKKEKKDKKKAA